MFCGPAAVRIAVEVTKMDPTNPATRPTALLKTVSLRTIFYALRKPKFGALPENPEVGA
jgi:hypothetical protein